MFFNSGSFKALENGARLTWMSQQIHLQNMANYETPNYKAKSLVFDDVLGQTKSAQASGKTIHARVVANEGTDSRIDGNNVNIEVEGLEMYKAQAQYSLILDKIKGQFNQYNAVLNSGMK